MNFLSVPSDGLLDVMKLLIEKYQTRMPLPVKLLDLTENLKRY